MKKIITIGCMSLVACAITTAHNDPNKIDLDAGNNEITDPDSGQNDYNPDANVSDSSITNIDSGKVKHDAGVDSGIQGCQVGYVSCGASCMPQGSTCCSNVSGEYCVNGGVCNSDGTCCAAGSTECGSAYCVQDGDYCCANVGHPELYCTPTEGTCNSNGTCGGCQLNANTTGCTNGAQTYVCTGAETPSTAINNLLCSTATVENGSEYYCCLQKCAPPNGLFQFVWTTDSGNCGNIPNDAVVFNGSANQLLYAAEICEIGAAPNPTFTQGNESFTPDNCSGAISASFSNNFFNPYPITGTDVVSITSNQNGTQLTGTVIVAENTVTGEVCSGTYSFIANLN